jgi:hypothetical protein
MLAFRLKSFFRSLGLGFHVSKNLTMSATRLSCDSSGLVTVKLKLSRSSDKMSEMNCLKSISDNRAAALPTRSEPY